LDTYFPRELQKQFEQAIIEKEFAYGEIITTHELAEQFKDSLEKIQRVLLSAYRKGLIAKLTDDAFRVIGPNHKHKNSIFNHAKASGFKPRSDVRLVALEPATSLIAEKLRLKPGERVFRIERTRYINEEVLANQTNYVPYDISPDLTEDDISHSSFQRLIEDKYYIFISKIEESFEIVPGSKQNVEILGLRGGSSILEIQRLAFSVSEMPVVWALIYINPKCYHYVAGLWPSAADLIEKRLHDDW